MKLIIEVDEKRFEEIKQIANAQFELKNKTEAQIIANGKPYDDSGDLISRRDLQAKHDESCAGECACCAYGVDYTKSSDSKFHCLLIDNAQAIPLPNEQIAWEQGYEAGLAQGKVEITEEQAINKLHETGWLIGHDKEMTTRPQGEWIEYNATGKKQYMCSECSMKEKNPKIARYCYWCGAKMKGGEE